MNITPYEPRGDRGPCQGSLYRDISLSIMQGNDIDADMMEFSYPYAVSLTQECDLEEDYNCRNIVKQDTGSDDKHLPMILLCPAFLAEQVKAGTHLDYLKLKMKKQTSDFWRLIQQNKNPRYHYLSAFSVLQVPDLVIDFKHFFTIPTNILLEKYGQEANHFARLNFLYREDLSQRFAFYLARIGLPIPHHYLNKPRDDVGMGNEKTQK